MRPTFLIVTRETLQISPGHSPSLVSLPRCSVRAPDGCDLRQRFSLGRPPPVFGSKRLQSGLCTAGSARHIILRPLPLLLIALLLLVLLLRPLLLLWRLTELTAGVSSAVTINKYSRQSCLMIGRLWWAAPLRWRLWRAACRRWEKTCSHTGSRYDQSRHNRSTEVRASAPPGFATIRYVMFSVATAEAPARGRLI